MWKGESIEKESKVCDTKFGAVRYLMLNDDQEKHICIREKDGFITGRKQMKCI